MSVELPLAPVDSLIRKADPDIRVSSEAAEELARRIQNKGSEIAKKASKRATEDGRKTIMPQDLDMDLEGLDPDDLILPVAPIDRIARLKIEDYRVSKEARLVLADYLEEWAIDVADSACTLAYHSGRKTIQAEDIEVYFEVCGLN